MDYDVDPRLPGLKGKGTGGIGLSFFPGPPYPVHAFGVDVTVWGVNRSYPSIVDGAADAFTELRTRALAVGARLGLPVTWPLGVSLLGGLTYMDHSMEVDGLPAWFLPGIHQTWKEQDSGWAPYWGVAGEVRFGAIGIGVEKRWVNTAATFDEPFSLTDVELGGSSTVVNLIWYTGR